MVISSRHYFLHKANRFEIMCILYRWYMEEEEEEEEEEETEEEKEK